MVILFLFFVRIQRRRILNERSLLFVCYFFLDVIYLYNRYNTQPKTRDFSLYNYTIVYVYCIEEKTLPQKRLH